MGHAGQTGDERADKLANQSFLMQNWDEYKYSRRCANNFLQLAHTMGKRVRLDENFSRYNEDGGNNISIRCLANTRTNESLPMVSKCY